MTEPRIDPDKLLELCRKRFKNDQPGTYREGYVTISWAFAMQIIDELRGAGSDREAAQNASLLNLIADIRLAAGDEGKLMQGELVEHIAQLRKKAATCDA